ncbi:2-dehydropantoate 2-reductase [Paenibacillus sp. J5C_2022]|uniref:ketopantoate reductase family protein n=1 Tax=Paenibacillus sp. J5C2022 TaxID=2977129 RepID=UPI0021D3EB79|nr:2-dehydropantoate 2-reductase [Paenibacillus sp. J5C2022]MCU6709490.1 2-dehydropantoate 2-reductase [Paenibacillus sp. J5C2022]
MHIDVIGAGALGMLLAAGLAESGAHVTLWTRTRRQAELIQERGVLRYRLDGCSDVIRIPCRSMGEDAAPAAERCVVLAVKATAIRPELMTQLHAIVGNDALGACAVVCLQNGVGHVETLAAALSSIPIHAAVTTEASRREDERTVRHTGAGEIWLSDRDPFGNAAGDAPIQKKLLQSLEKAGFTSFLSNDINTRIYRKLLANAVINPLTALYCVTNGELPQENCRLTLMRRLYEETAEVLMRSGLLPSEDYWQSILAICEATSGNRSSMLSDVQAGRETEIAFINGAIAAKGRELRMPTPLNDALIAIIQAYRKPLDEDKG